MFAMSLIYALHSLGLGSCPLNTSYIYNDDKKLRQVAEIEQNEIPIVTISVGYLKEIYKVAVSPRNKAEEKAIFHYSLIKN